ncbi:unnamed protein product [Mytilus coruscus]|uniref:Integrase catalytic domain-containing protein n=1 Tax=Mytilus coruscus TaxID=42192 RepID=A0A6J8D2K9_MYTCO|nr:unnamed protein product [Mytilus coruscus]
MATDILLMMLDQFIKWIEMTSIIPEQTYLNTAKKVLIHFMHCNFWMSFFCCLFWTKEVSFQIRLFKANFIELLEIAKTRTTPYRPSSNGQVERYNTTVLAMIRCYIEKKNRTWDRDLPLLAMALHSTANRNTGFTANKLLLGRETTQPIHLLLGLPANTPKDQEGDPWVIELAKNFSRIHHFARQNLKVAQLRQRRDYDMRILEHTYHIGDLVFLLDSSTKVGHSKKLKPPWKGPFLVVERQPPLYKIKGGKEEKTVHHDRLKRCNDRHIPLWIKRMRHELFNMDESLPVELVEKSVDTLDETLPYTEECFNSLSSNMEQVDDNTFSKTKYDIIEVETPQETNLQEVDSVVTRKGRKVQKPSYLENFV